MKIWMNGEIVDASGALNAADRGFLLGDSVFETLLVRNGAPLFLSRHLTRLDLSLRALKFTARISVEEVREAIALLAVENNLYDQLAAARITISRGAGSRGLALPSPEQSSPNCVIALHPASQAETTVSRAKVSTFCRASTSVNARHKTGGYLDQIMARDEAQSEGYDDAVLTNEFGRPVCFSAANLFVQVEQTTFVTPPVEEGALPGIVRGLLLEGAEKTGLTIREEPVDRAQCEGAMLLMTNSLIGVRAASIGEAKIDKPALQRLQTWYDDVLKTDEAGN